MQRLQLKARLVVVLYKIHAAIYTKSLSLLRKILRTEDAEVLGVEDLLNVFNPCLCQIV